MTTRKRFYKDVTVADDFGIALDGRAVKTPMKAPLLLPTRALADTAIDRVGQHRAAIEQEVLDYANSDLVCYRTDRPPELVARHVKSWDPVVDWARTVLDAPFEVTDGILHRPQPEAALAAFAVAVQALSDFELAAFHSIMTLTGSALIAMMLARKAMVPEAAWLAAHVDEDYQIEHWGQDSEAQARRAARYAEFMACCRFLELSRA
jgi:chaperone required for assembly of F1-ATPase